MTKGKVKYRELEDGYISISYTDYDVEIFGGEDYEANYKLNPENKAKLRAYLEQTQSGTMEEMIIAEFGIHLDKKSFAAVCEENGIEYELYTWIG